MAFSPYTDLIPHRTAMETARLTLTPGGPEDMPIVTALAVQTGMRVMGAALPFVLRAVLPERAREPLLPRVLRGTGDAIALLKNLGGKTTPDQEWLRQRGFLYPRALVTHPQTQELLRMLRREDYGAVADYVARRRETFEPFLDEILVDIARFGSADRAASWPFPTDPPQEIFSPQVFSQVNTRGILDYSHHFFGRDPLEKLGRSLRPEETILWKMVWRVPRGGIVTDWGGGAGIFGFQVKERRGDLEVIVNDLHSPEAILEYDPRRKEIPTPQKLRRFLTFLTGDAMTTTLPDGKKAHLTVSASLSPYVPDPLRLLAQLYNQTAVGGIVLSTVTTEILNSNRDWEDARSIVAEAVEDLKNIGVPVEVVQDSRTMAIQRIDNREMKVRGHFVGSYLGHYLVGTRWIPAYTSFYRSAGGNGGRWLGLG